MNISNYREFVQLVEQYKILPFSDFVPEYPSLNAVAASHNWHTGLDSDPWLWRIRIVSDGVSAYGKFFGSKVSFIHISLFPLVKTVLTSDRTAEERYRDGVISKSAYHIYTILADQGTLDSRSLRKIAGLYAKEDKKNYEKSLIELQNFCDIVITGAQESDNDSGWSSMCYECSDKWLRRARLSAVTLSIENAKHELRAELNKTCTEKAFKFFAKKMRLDM